MPRQDLLLAVESLAAEKIIDREIVMESLEAAIAKIAGQKYGTEFNIAAHIDRRNGAINVKRLFDVVDPDNLGEDELGEPIPFNSDTMITVAKAKKYAKDPKIGDVVEDPLPEPEFGRMAFQTAKQIMTARVRDAEKGRQFEEFNDNIGDIVNGVVKRIEFGNVFVTSTTAPKDTSSQPNLSRAKNCNRATAFARLSWMSRVPIRAPKSF